MSKTFTTQLKELGLSQKGIKSVINHVYYCDKTIKKASIYDTIKDNDGTWIVITTPFTEEIGELRILNLDKYMEK